MTLSNLKRTMAVMKFDSKIKEKITTTCPRLGGVFQLCVNIIKFNLHLLFLLLRPASHDHRTVTITRLSGTQLAKMLKYSKRVSMIILQCSPTCWLNLPHMPPVTVKRTNGQNTTKRTFKYYNRQRVSRTEWDSLPLSDSRWPNKCLK